ncbi:transcriptional regulator [Betaproteobacteria bacterium]|nr:transcriptional regulator [Betaproteobacteria bacterium]GHU03460.1 transcriptional regulator [Betaproteobacteria bacterium]GHU20922.1 transcriptional regulator [Betaproteobacteria bacterium]
MEHVSLATIDLNLLKTFQAIWELRSLTAASDRLKITQPAVSHALRKLREIFDDPLFVRNANEMVPTDTAARLHAPIDEALRIINGALQKQLRFDPAVTRRTFRVVMSDMAEQYVLPALLKRLAGSAPGIRFEIKQMPIERLIIAMRNGDVDLALGYLAQLDEQWCDSSALMEDEFVCMVRSEHPLAGRKLSVDDLNQLSYVHVDTPMTQHGLANEALQRAGVECNIMLRLAHFTVVPQIIANTDLAVILPRRITELSSAQTHCLLPLPTDIDMPQISVKVYSHNRFGSDAGISWLRATLLALFSSAGDD